MHARMVLPRLACAASDPRACRAPTLEWCKLFAISEFAHCLQVVVKSQILAGGRGLGKFTNGLQASAPACSSGQLICCQAELPHNAVVMLMACLGKREAAVPTCTASLGMCLAGSMCPDVMFACVMSCSFVQGGVHICKASEAKDLAAKMLGGTLVTKQASPCSLPRRPRSGQAHSGGRAPNMPEPSSCVLACMRAFAGQSSDGCKSCPADTGC